MNSNLAESDVRGHPGEPPFFSVAVPCCDVAPYLDECLASLLAQPFPDWECLLYVEESRDGTLGIAKKHAMGDPRFRVFEGPRTGSCSVPRNRCVEEAHGEYVVFLDGDDSLVPGALARLADAIASRPGADIYPCAVQVHDDRTGLDTELRDNYPPDAPPELTGVEATLLAESFRGYPNPMMQMAILRRGFLLENRLSCIPGLLGQDREFSPRALFAARRVVPLHETYYIYRKRLGAVTVSTGNARLLTDQAIIHKSLFAFHATVRLLPGFDSRLTLCWARCWSRWVFHAWFSPRNVALIPRARRLETLRELFSGGFGDFDALMAGSPLARRIAAAWMMLFVGHPLLRPLAEWFFRLYFALSQSENRRKSK